MIVNVYHNHIEVEDYEIGTRPQLEKRFKLWNPTFHRYEDVSFFHDGRNLYLPRGINLQTFNNDDVNMIFEPNPYDKIDITLYRQPRDDFQVNSINFLCGLNGFDNSRVSSQIVLTAPPGYGKTYCAIASICHYKFRTLIIVHRKKILDQWKQELLDCTDIKENEIMMLSTDKMRYLVKNGINDNIKVILASHQTFTSIGNKEGWDLVRDGIKNMRVGLKIVDEAHRHFRNTFLIDAHSKIKKNIYLTATFNRSDYKEDKLFQDAFANTPKYGEHMVKEGRKHIIYISVYFNSRPSYEEILHMKGYGGGFDKNKYTEYQINRGIISEAMVKLYDKYFSKHEGKTLILSSKINSSEYFAHIMKMNFDDRKVYIYNSKVDQETKDEAMEKADIISATPSSLGEGTNYKGLRYLFMLEPYASKVNAFQNPSRLREYAPDKYTFYVEFIDEGFKDVVEWTRRRRKKFKEYFHSQRNVRIEDL